MFTPDMAAEPSHHGPPISDRVARHIASGFRVPPADVVFEARLVSGWGGGSSDDLLVWLEHRHSWNARRAVLYLLSLHGALRNRFEFR
jgi:hypothetical protein